MTKELFIQAHVNELTGFCLEAFLLVLTESERKVSNPGYSAARKGEFMIAQMQRVREFLGQLYDELPGPRPSSDKEIEQQIAKEVEDRVSKIKADLIKPKKHEDVIADAKSLNAEERAKFKSWAESLFKTPPLAHANGASAKPLGATK